MSGPVSAAPPLIFLSHSSADAATARELRTVLEGAGYACWMAPDDVDGSDPWAEQILAAINASRAMLVLISSNANQSAHVSREVNLALGRRRAVLPIRIEAVAPEASLEYLLSLVQRVDAFPPPITAHGDRIVRRLSRLVPLPGVDVPSITESVATPALADPRAADGSIAEGHVSDAPRTAPAAPLLSPASIGPGSRIDDFTIESVLGEGGMATVYRARQEQPTRRAALKVIRADHAADATYRQRFLVETRTLASLEHPSIVPIYAAGAAGDTLYIAMRLVDGPDLAGRISELGKLSVPETLEVLRPIADAVDYAHDLGIVHRDLKPSNIVLDKRGRAYLTDFGLGKHIEGGANLSKPGIALGTLAYMAPEQFTGKVQPELAGRIDVYGLACVAFTCLTGAQPFEGATPEQLMYAHVHEPLPDRPEIPALVGDVLRRATAKDPAARFETAGAFIAAMASAAAASAPQTVPIVNLRPSRNPLLARASSGPFAMALAALGLAAVLATGFLLTRATGGAAIASASPSAGSDASQVAAGSAPPPSPSPEPSITASLLPTMSVEPTVSFGPTPTPAPTPTPTRSPTPRPPTPTATPTKKPTPPSPTPTPRPAMPMSAFGVPCTIIGTQGDDGASPGIVGTSGNDVICGLGGNDLIVGNGGNDRIDGGPGTDRIWYGNAPGAVTVNFSTNTVTGAAGTDQLRNVEGAMDSQYSDTLVGDAGSDYFWLHDGADTVDGNGGEDSVDYTYAAAGECADDSLTSIENIYPAGFCP